MASQIFNSRRLRGKRLTPEVFLRRRRWRSRWGAAGLIVVLALVFLADRSGLLVYGGADATRYDGRSFTVVGVVDGDTLDLDTPDGRSATTRVRLWGINTPESARADRPAEPGAESATQRVTELAFGQRVTIRLEPHRPRGRYGRLLVYAVLPDGTILNERLLSEGLARADDRWPHRDVDRYAQLEDQARREQLGLWAEP
ncbi:MAG: thermonuclease family protein [Planctomycetota bacterium]